jgi:threonine aldolase
MTKGLACPIGAAVIGSKEDVIKLTSIRKALGGGLWHPGLLTAAATYSF